MKGKKKLTEDQPVISCRGYLIALKIHKAQQHHLPSQRPLQPTISLYVLWSFIGNKHTRHLNIADYRECPCSSGWRGKKRGGESYVRFKFRARSLKPSKKGGKKASRQGALDEMSSVFKSLPLVPAVSASLCRKECVQSLTQDDFGPTILSRKRQDGLCRHKGGKKKIPVFNLEEYKRGLRNKTVHE